jgi:predicted alpha/beta superfamily hydrolase
MMAQNTRGSKALKINTFRTQSFCMGIFCLFVFVLACLSSEAQPLPEVTYGKIVRIKDFKTTLIEPRNVDIWLPDGFDSTKTYDVVYMHDGQMLFDSTKTWNKTSWDADETFGKLIESNTIRECIIVGIWNVPEKRFADYFPQRIIDKIPKKTRKRILEKQIQGKPSADHYLKFIVDELKPYIDKDFPTNPEAQNTFMIGSSMGGLISIYSLLEYPEVFGGVACLSIHSPLASFELIDENTDQEVASKFRKYLKAHLPEADSKKIYFDYGDQTGDSFYQPYQKKNDKIMSDHGYTSDFWQTVFFEGESHTETSWAKRLDIPVSFLLKKG